MSPRTGFSVSFGQMSNFLLEVPLPVHKALHTYCTHLLTLMNCSSHVKFVQFTCVCVCVCVACLLVSTIWSLLCGMVLTNSIPAGQFVRFDQTFLCSMLGCLSSLQGHQSIKYTTLPEILHSSLCTTMARWRRRVFVLCLLVYMMMSNRIVYVE